jgi:uncharacterized protein (DUF2267 family)
MIRSIDSIERTVHKTNEWLNELDAELGRDDKELAWRVLKGHLQVLRDQVTLDEAAQLAAQLPMLVRGAFYEGFDPSRKAERLRDRELFLAAFAERAQLDADDSFIERAAEAATTVLQHHVTGGELDDVLSQLPGEVREVLQHSA